MFKYFILYFLLLVSFISNSQQIRVIDNKGTIAKVRNTQVKTSTTAPTNPLEGNVWFDSSTNNSKIYDGTQWLTIDLDMVTTNATAPTTPVIGDVWIDTSSSPNSNKIWDGTQWNTLGYASGWSLTGNVATNPTTNFIGTTDAQDLVLKTNNIEKLRLGGIKKEVLVNQANSFGNAPFIVRANDVELMGFQDNTGTTKWHWNLKDNGFNFVETGISDYRLFIKEGGNVGIGTATPSATLHINADSDVGPFKDPSLRIGSRTGDHLALDGNEIGAYNNNSFASLFINASGSNSTTSINPDGGRVGIGTKIPEEKLDINGKLRIRDIENVTTDNLDVLVSSASGVVQKKTILPNKSYVQNYTTSKDITNGGAVVLNTFPQLTIQPNKKVKIELYVPTRSFNESWGGLFVNVNVNVNGTWYNLGNTGYDGGAMFSGTQTIHALNHEMLLDFITHLGLPTTASYTVQFELTARTYFGTVTVNGDHEINNINNNLASRGTPVSWAKDQNFTHIIVTEMDR